MTSKIVYYWRVFCQTENAYVFVWSETEPTVCPNDPVNHTIDSSQTTIVQQISDSFIRIQEETTPTQGLYRFQGYEYAIPSGTPGDVTVIDVTWPRGITMLNGDFDATSDHVGDEIDADAAPQSPIGYITQDVAINDTIIHVSATVFEHMSTGFIVTLTDGVNTVDLGECLSKDTVAGTITVETPSSVAFAAATPTYIKITAHVVNNLKVRIARLYAFAKKRRGGKTFPAGVPFRIYYKNNSGVAKSFGFNLEYMY